MNENFNQELFKAIDTIRNKQEASIESIFEQMIKTPNESIWKSLFEDRIGALVTNDMLEKKHRWDKNSYNVPEKSKKLALNIDGNITEPLVQLQD